MERRQSSVDLPSSTHTYSSSKSPFSPPPSSSPRAASEPPSSPLSVLSKTPSLPNSPIVPITTGRRYPSPESLSADTPGSQTPAKRADRSASQSDDGSTGDRPSKRRKAAAPKDRTTKRLDLSKTEAELTPEDIEQRDRLLSALRKKKKIVVVAGAGISVSAGIPDFRSSNGLFAITKKQYNVKSSGKHLFDASVYKHDSSTQSFHDMVRDMAKKSAGASPTLFHHMLASLAQEGRLLRLYSQNIDCIDTQMKPLETNVPLNPKGPWPKTIQLHGGLQHMVCTKCSDLSPLKPELFNGPEPPLCSACAEQDSIRTNFGGKRSHGIGRIRPRFVLYNEYNPDEEAIGNVSSADLRTRPDAVIVVGTTLKVPGTRRLVKELCQVTRGRKDGFTAWINLSPEPKGADLKDCWDLVVQSKCDAVADLASLPRSVDIGDAYLLSQKDELDANKTNIQIRLPSKSPSADDSIIETPTSAREEAQAIPTPKASPKLAAVKLPKQTKLGFGTSEKREAGKTKKTSKPRPRKPKTTGKPAQPKSTAADFFKTGKRVPTGKNVDAKSVVTNLALDVAQPAVSTVALLTRGAVKEEEPATPVSDGKVDCGTISSPSVPNGMKELFT
ncbi:NAD-dependent histone deacetylase SIR2 [Cordyceps fumosorosea ARSEF 2679]|uniref:NAD-dependent histone deacetylase SIR2 n=1 Tax=Cordyceps fumosorosea (strain ARSEF 2679) TaxID=1081104 RepID=A0A168E7A1_CORFA|nr:NAD-dependent histone deacetylase SIR2 [Cordyceps fumosorosea ARSEF 2679]OAA73457.1 NAD-dependent histone deacetylase SIR2 [Cordyceps fumosorosea ARSEF 2679]